MKSKVKKKGLSQRREKPFRIRQPIPAGYVTIQQAADYLGVSERSIRRYIKEYGLPVHKPGGRYLISIEELETWIRRHE